MPHPDLLSLNDNDKYWLENPSFSTDDYNGICKMSSFLMSQTVYQGTHLLHFCIKQPLKEEEAEPPLLMLWRLLELGDSISILMRNEITETTATLLRIILEIYISINFLLEDSDQYFLRANAYLTWKYFDMLDNAKLCDSNTEEGKKLHKLLGEDTLLGNGIFRSEDTTEYRNKIKEKLKSAKFKECYNKYNSIRKKNKQIKWYELCSDKHNLFKLAEHLNLQGTYKLIYSPYSELIHGINPNAIGGGKNIYFHDLRKVNENIHRIVSQSIGLILKSMIKILSNYPYTNKNELYYKECLEWCINLLPILKKHLQIDLKLELKNNHN